MNPIYFDYLATTPVDPAVAAEMARYLSIDGAYGNAASRSHRLGWEAEQAVENARRQVASLLNADVREIVWTSGATESDNLAIKGVVQGVMQESRQPDRGDVPHVVTSAIEHKAVLDSCAFLESQGVKVTYLAPDEKGLIAPHAVAAAITPNTSLVSIMHANNEIGTINDIAAISKITREANVVFHVDAAQSVGKIPVDVKALDVDLLSLSAHKFYGPKGMGVLYVRRGFSAPLVAQIHGGGHERGMRSGTLATHQIVGIGKAAELANSKLAEESARLTGMRDSLLSQLSDIDGISLNGDDTHRLPGALNISVANVEGEALLLSLSEFALSTGSACTSASMEPSYVLRALGLDDVLAHSSLRVSLGRFTTTDEIAQFSQRMHEIVPRLRRDAA